VSSNSTLLLEHRYIRVRRCRHGLFAYNKNDVFIGRALDLYGEWCEAELALLGQLLRPGHVAVDAGAHLGTHAVFFARSVAPGGAVIAIEPQRVTFQLLCANVALNALTNVRTLHMAASDERGIITVPVLDPAVEFNFGAFPIEGYAAGDSVPAMPLDDLELARCDLIKVDVEGMEEKVLRGARNALRRFRPVLFVENNSEERSATLISLLRGLDYAPYWHIAPYFNPRNFFGTSENCFADFQPEANLLCLPSGAPIDPGPLWPVIGNDDTWKQAVVRHASR
jgi:FkbM family methyltransferase